MKGGLRVGPDKVREFAHVLKREKADLGIFFMRGEPTRDMKRDAVSLGYFKIGSRSYPRLQIVSLAGWFAGLRPDMPPPIPMKAASDRAAPSRRVKRPDPRQPAFPFVINPDAAKRKGTILNPAIVPDDMLRERPSKRLRARLRAAPDELAGDPVGRLGHDLAPAAAPCRYAGLHR